MSRGLMRLSTFDKCREFLYGPMPRMSGGMPCMCGAQAATKQTRAAPAMLNASE